MNNSEWMRLRKGDLVAPNKMARSDVGIRCIVENIGKPPTWPYVCIRPAYGERFPNGCRIRFISYKCLDVLKE